MGEENLKLVKPVKNIVIVQDDRLLEEMIGMHLTDPKYAGIHNFPFETNVSYVTPSKKLSKGVISARKTDLIITDLYYNYSHVLKTAKSYTKKEIPVIVVVRGNESIKEINYAIDSEASLVIHIGYFKTNHLIQAIDDILKGNEINQKIGFGAPKDPGSKVGPIARGFSHGDNYSSGRTISPKNM